MQEVERDLDGNVNLEVINNTGLLYRMTLLTLEHHPRRTHTPAHGAKAANGIYRPRSHGVKPPAIVS